MASYIPPSITPLSPAAPMMVVGGRRSYSIDYTSGALMPTQSPQDFEQQVYENKEVGRKAEYKRVVEKYDPLTMQWQTKEQVDDDKPAQTKEKIEGLEECCFVFRKKLTPQGQDMPPYIETFVDIKSWYLREAGKEVIGTNAGISWGAKALELDSYSLLPYYGDLRALMVKTEALEEKSEDDKLVVAHLEIFLGFLAEEFKDILSELADLNQAREITWERLWSIWKPGTLFVMRCPVTELPFVVRLICALPGKDLWQLNYEYLDSTKNDFGFTTNILQIDKFLGRIPTHNLDAYPLVHHPDHEELKKTLIARGKRWRELFGIHHLHYEGHAYMRDSHQRVKKLKVRGRVMVDKEAYHNTQSDFRLNPFFNSFQPYGATAPVIGKITAHIKDPSPEDLLLSPTYVSGFSLADKRWLMFEVSSLTEIKFDPTSFRNLVIPDERKALLQGLVEAHGRTTSFDDILATKGKGLVINLYGPPGTGKTLTAEATSEYVRKPLYVVTAGELGSESNGISVQLTHIFDICAKWGAIVLLDEADVFLERRSTHEVHRNAMVSVFLRELEYFEGILFLTTNRIETFDPAFQSRIHISLRYTDLDFTSRRDIWRSILRKAGLHDDSLSRDEIGALATPRKNGRQIRNIVRTAEAVAVSRNEPLDYQHLSQVKEITEKFDKPDGVRLPSLFTLLNLTAVAGVVGVLVMRHYRGLL